MKKLIVLAVFLITAGSLFAGGKECERAKAKSVQLTGTIACSDGSTNADCARVFRLANGTQYTICEKSKANLRAVSGANVRVTGKIVSCDHGEELLIEKASKI